MNVALKMQMNTWVCLAVLALSCVAVPRRSSGFSAGLRIETQSSDGGRLEWPVFSGEPARSADLLNAWVKGHWANERGCGDTTGDSTHHLSVLRVTSSLAVFLDAGEASCPNSAHPSSWNQQWVVDMASGETVDVWKSLSDSSQSRLRAQLAEQALKVHALDECAELYKTPAQLDRLEVNFNGRTIRFKPNLSHAERACVEFFSMAMVAFRNEFEIEGTVRGSLASW
jgi:hypothetical protein